MKGVVLLVSIFLLTVSAENCGKKLKPGVYKGKLEIKQLCMNYTVRLVKGDLDTSKIVSSWTDESTNKTYNNVFGLRNPCQFPHSIKQADEFYFVIDTPSKKECVVCMAYYPTPPRKLAFKVVNP